MSFANFPYLSPIPASFCFDDTVVVLGVGPFGMCFLMKARMLGSGTIIAVDLSDFRLNFAQRLGADYIINRSAAGRPGSHGKPAAYGPSLRQMLRYMKHYPLHEFVTHRYALRDVEAAVKKSMEPESMKVVLEPWH